MFVFAAHTFHNILYIVVYDLLSGKRQGVCDVNIDQKAPADQATISHWESVSVDVKVHAATACLNLFLVVRTNIILKYFKIAV